MARRSIKGPVVIFVVVLVLTITLTVLWNVVLVHDYRRIEELAASDTSGPFHTTFIAVGSTLFLAIIVLVSIFAAQMFAEIRWGRRQQNFLASVSHELNSPLQSIKLQAQTLSRPGVSDTHRQKFLAALMEDVDRLSALIGNVLRAAQIDQQSMTCRTEAVPLRAFLVTYTERSQATFERAGLRRTIEVEPGNEFIVDIDRALLRQLLDNLVDNAVKYSPEDRCRIRLSLEEVAPGSLHLLVSDRGIGLPLGERRKIFDRFYRIEDDDPRRSRKGTGLGLAIVHSIAEAHGWTAFARSAGSDKGVTIGLQISNYERDTTEDMD